MAFRTARTAAVCTFFLLPVLGCGTGEQDRATLPPDTARLSAQDLARLPWFGVQRLPCDTVHEHLQSTGDTSVTGTVEISREGDSLVLDPPVLVARLGDTIRWRSDSLVWVARFKDRSPFEGDARTVRGTGTALKSAEAQAAPGEAVSVVADDEARCGRYYFFVAAYDPSQPDRVYVADPPGWAY